MQPKFRIQTELPYEKQLMHKEIVMKKNRDFFTLIELLIVIAMITIRLNSNF